MYSNIRMITLPCILTLVIILSLTGCKKPEPARLMIQVDGELFSNALLFIDGQQAGKLTKTLIKTDGQLFIDDIYTVTLPPGHKDIPDEQDECTGTLDSLQIKAGTYLLLLQADDGTSLQIKASLPPGLTAITYDSDKQLLKWNGSSMEAAPGSTVTINQKP